MISTNEKTRKISVNEGKLLGIRSLGRPIGVKAGIPRARFAFSVVLAFALRRENAESKSLRSVIEL